MAFVVHMLNRTVEVDWFGREVSIPLSYADGMIGAMPVFETLEQAEALADGRYSIKEVELIPTPPDPGHEQEGGNG